MRRSNKRYLNSALQIVCPILRLAKAVTKTLLYMAFERDPNHLLAADWTVYYS